MRFSRLLCLLTLTALLCGCSSVSYYQQAISGHLNLSSQRQPIDRLIDNPATTPQLRTQLEKITDIREFAKRELGLPSNGNYNSYADLKRRYVVWNVFAAPELSLKAKNWCYFFIGCASYRGYYSEEKAHQYAAKLQSEGMDVYVAGIAAYSTLGWFNDPVLNTFIHREDAQLANLIFHELAHQKLYIKGDTLFNESFATVVANEGVKRWLLNRGGESAYRAFLEQQHKEQAFIDLVLDYREQLNILYASDESDNQKRAGKALLIEELRTAHQQLKTTWGGRSNYEKWFKGDLNNAKLNTVATYFDLVPALQALLAENEFNLNAFYQACLTLNKQPISVRHNKLTGLTPVQRAIDPQPTTL